MDKRRFLKQISLLGAGSLTGVSQLNAVMAAAKDIPANTLAGEEDFWAVIRKGYRLKPDYINLENGYYNFLPEATLEKYIAHIREINYQGSYYMRTVQWDNKKRMAAKLAAIAGCSPDELIITRNTTESLDMIIAGQNWQAGDEAVMAEQDYGAMLDMFKQVAKRHGVVNKIISVPTHPKSDEEIVQLYANVKLVDRGVRMVMEQLGLSNYEEAKDLLLTHGSVKKAVDARKSEQ